MNFQDFVATVESLKLELDFDQKPALANPTTLKNEALFHLPLIAISVLMLARGRSKPKVDALGQLIGQCFERTLAGFKGSSQHLGWSATLRLRTVEALTFLESASLVYVDPFDNAIEATSFGKEVLERALRQESELAYTLRSIQRSYTNIRSERQQEFALS